jgi:N-acetylmuramoyl-L-alanine amidase
VEGFGGWEDLMGLTRKWFPSPNYSVGRSHAPRLLVLHTTEGARTIESLGNYFANRANEVSSHAGADDTPKTIGVYVKRENRAWTQSNANSDSVSIEMCAFARWPTEEWLKHPVLLENVARWLSEEALHYGIPLERLSPSQAQGMGRGVCQHVDLGSWGGGHSDCGGGFPMGAVLDRARNIGNDANTRLFTWYFLQDVTASRLARGQRMYYGGWGSKEARDEKSVNLTNGFLHPFRNFRDDDFESPYFIDNSAYVKEIYGGWRSEASRDDARKTLEATLGRPLRPFSEQRTLAQGGVPWGCRNLQTP